MRRIPTLAAAGALALLGACGPDSNGDATVASTSPAEAPAVSPATQTPASALPDGAVVLADFTVRADPRSGTFDIVRVTETVEGRQLRTTGQAIWCEATVDSDGVAGSGADDSVELFTVDGSVEFALSTDADILTACRSAALNAEDARYDDLFLIDGVFCADVGVRNFYAETVNDLHITLSYTGDVAHTPYQHPYGTGADPSVLRGAGVEDDAPSHADGGLIEYGDIDAGANTIVRWFFKHGNDSPFEFTGQVWFSPTEDCDNDADDDCDGIIDNACREFADGSDCVEAADCESGVCTGGVCQVPTCDDEVENGTETGVDCGGSCAADCVNPETLAIANRGACAAVGTTVRCWGNVANEAATDIPGTYNGTDPADSVNVEMTSMSGKWWGGCGLTATGEVYCWSANSRNVSDQLNSAALGDDLRAVNIGGTAKLVSGGESISCAVREDDVPFCWGNFSNALGTGTTSTQFARSAPALSLPVVQPAGGWQGTIVELEAFAHGAVIRTDEGVIYGWGQLPYAAPHVVSSGYWGDAPGEVAARWPAPPAPATEWIQVEAAGYFACALDDLHRLWCNGNGVNIGPQDPTTRLFQVSSITGPIEQMYDGFWALCGERLDDGQVRCWGSVGTGGLSAIGAPRPDRSSNLPTAPDEMSLASGWGCARWADDIYCWGAMSEPGGAVTAIFPGVTGARVRLD